MITGTSGQGLGDGRDGSRLRSNSNVSVSTWLFSATGSVPGSLRTFEGVDLRSAFLALNQEEIQERLGTPR